MRKSELDNKGLEGGMQDTPLAMTADTQKIAQAIQ